MELDGNSNAVFTVFEKDGMICSSQLQTGYNYMDAEPDNGALFDGGLVWPIGKLKNPNFYINMVIMNAAASYSKKRAGGQHSGYSPRLSVPH